MISTFNLRYDDGLYNIYIKLIQWLYACTHSFMESCLKTNDIVNSVISRRSGQARNVSF